MLLAILSTLLLTNHAVAGFSITINGKALTPAKPTDSFINIAGTYGDLGVINSQAGKTAHVYFINTNSMDFIALTDVTFVANKPVVGMEIKSTQDFNPGPIGNVVAKVGIDGFFASKDGITVPTLDLLAFSGYLNGSQIDDTLMANVTNKQSQTFSLSGKDNRVLAGPRTLVGDLFFNLEFQGDTLTLPGSAFVADVPEPATWIMAMTSALALGGLHVVRRQRAAEWEPTRKRSPPTRRTQVRGRI